MPEPSIEGDVAAVPFHVGVQKVGRDQGGSLFLHTDAVSYLSQIVGAELDQMGMTGLAVDVQNQHVSCRELSLCDDGDMP